VLAARFNDINLDRWSLDAGSKSRHLGVGSEREYRWSWVALSRAFLLRLAGPVTPCFSVRRRSLV
jgi:hypothetical protein